MQKAQLTSSQEKFFHEDIVVWEERKKIKTMKIFIINIVICLKYSIPRNVGEKHYKKH